MRQLQGQAGRVRGVFLTLATSFVFQMPGFPFGSNVEQLSATNPDCLRDANAMASERQSNSAKVKKCEARARVISLLSQR
jgi:hypothetical protein